MDLANPEVFADLEAPQSEVWSRDDMRVRFLLIGVPLFATRLPALVMRAPFNYITKDDSDPPPAPQRFPDGVQAVRLHICPVGAAKPAITILPNAIRYIAGAYRHLYIEINGDFEQYLQKFSSKSRWTLRKKVKKYLESAGPGAFREYCALEEMEEFYRVARSVAVKTYQDRLRNASMPKDPGYVEHLKKFARRGEVHGYLLFHQGEPVAYSYCLAREDTLTLWYTGFDPKYAHLHAGTVLTYLLLERLFGERRFKIYDFGSGDFEYKGFFATGSVHRGDVMYLRRTVRNLALVYALEGLFTASERFKRVLDIFGARAKMRRWLHRLLY